MGGCRFDLGFFVSGLEGGVIGREGVEAMLPHREGMLLVDEITGFTGGARPVLTARFVVSGEEPWLRGHFPGRPVWPGVLLIEGLAQCAGLVVQMAGREATRSAAVVPGLGVLAAVNVKLLRMVVPPAVVVYQARLIGVFGGLFRVDAEAAVDGVAVADGSLSIAVREDGERSG